MLLGLEIVVSVAILTLFLLAIALTIKCTVDIDRNSSQILCQRFFGVTTFTQNLELNSILGMWLVGEEDMPGSRMVLELKSEEIVPITHIGNDIDSLAKIKVCEIFNNLVASISNSD